MIYLSGDGSGSTNSAGGISSINGMNRQSSCGTFSVQTSQQNGRQCRVKFSFLDQIHLIISSDGAVHLQTNWKFLEI
jgi:hypothetical protein